MGAITLDASTPATATSSDNTTGIITTASFSPPANTLLVAIVDTMFHSGAGSASITMSSTISGNPAWANGVSAVRAGVSAWIFLLQLSGAQSGITVTATNSSAAQQGMLLSVQVLNGASLSQSAAASITSSSASTMAADGALFTTVNGSWGYVAAALGGTDTLTVTGATTTITDFADSADGAELAAGTMTVQTGTPAAGRLGTGIPVSLGWTANTAKPLAVAALEILPEAKIAFIASAEVVDVYPSPGPVIPYASGAGSTLIISGNFGNPNFSATAYGVASITDSAGNYWRFSALNCQNPPAAYDPLYDPSSGTWAFTAWCINALPVEWVAVYDNTGNANTWLLSLSEWSGINSEETGISGYVASGSNPGGTLTLGNADDLVIGALSSDTGSPSAVPAGAGETTASVNASGIYIQPGKTGSYAFNWTGSATDWVYSIAVFSPVVIPPPSEGPVYSGYQVG